MNGILIACCIWNAQMWGWWYFNCTYLFQYVFIRLMIFTFIFQALMRKLLNGLFYNNSSNWMQVVLLIAVQSTGIEICWLLLLICSDHRTTARLFWFVLFFWSLHSWCLLSRCTPLGMLNLAIRWHFSNYCRFITYCVNCLLRRWLLTNT